MKKGIVRVLCGLMITQIAFSHTVVYVNAENVEEQDLEEISETVTSNAAEGEVDQTEGENIDDIAGEEEPNPESPSEEDLKNVDVSSDFTVNLLHKSSRNGQQDSFHIGRR